MLGQAIIFEPEGRSSTPSYGAWQLNAKASSYGYGSLIHDQAIMIRCRGRRSMLLARTYVSVLSEESPNQPFHLSPMRLFDLETDKMNT